MNFRHNPNSWELASAICWLNKHYSETNRFCLHLIPLQPCRIPEYQSVTAEKHPSKGSKSFFGEANENMQMDSTTERGKLTGGTCAHYPLSNVSSRLLSTSPQSHATSSQWLDWTEMVRLLILFVGHAGKPGEHVSLYPELSCWVVTPIAQSWILHKTKHMLSLRKRDSLSNTFCMIL